MKTRKIAAIAMICLLAMAPAMARNFEVGGGVSTIISPKGHPYIKAEATINSIGTWQAYGTAGFGIVMAEEQSGPLTSLEAGVAYDGGLFFAGTMGLYTTFNFASPNKRTELGLELGFRYMTYMSNFYTMYITPAIVWGFASWEKGADGHMHFADWTNVGIKLAMGIKV